MTRTLTIPRKPDFIIGSPDKPYLRRWWVIPRNRWFNIYLHNILADDDDRAEHCHPWWSISVILRGGYIETINGVPHVRHPGTIRWRRATEHHRLALFRNHWRGDILQPIVPAWTLFITGPRVREWGFHCPNGWRHWREFTNAANPGEVGRGCE
jgi:hypothetical protein